MISGLKDSFTIGQDAFFESVSPTSSFGVTFEDDLTTGYFYAVDTNPDLKVLDALHVYDVDDVERKDLPREIIIAWSDDGQIASLLINNYCHALFDFTSKAGYCRNGFPESNGEWCEQNNRVLTDELIEKFFATHH